MQVATYHRAVWRSCLLSLFCAFWAAQTGSVLAEQRQHASKLVGWYVMLPKGDEPGRLIGPRNGWDLRIECEGAVQILRKRGHPDAYCTFMGAPQEAAYRGDFPYLLEPQCEEDFTDE